MRWLTFAILAILVVSLQATVMPRTELFGARADLVLVLTVFYALHVRREEAMLAGWMVGALADVMTLERFGLLALSYGLAAAAVGQVRDLLFGRHPLTHFSVTLLAALLLQVAWALYRVVLGLPGGSVGLALGSCAYTAFWAVGVHMMLLQAPRLLGIPRPGMSFSTRSAGRS
ncbi:MAG: rod shape-determining protein MreD [bacterium]|nr:rod shape-determining protein MreD [bacterium]